MHAEQPPGSTRPLPEDVGARVRAALAYARKDANQAAAILNVSKRTLDRIYNNERDLRLPEAKRLADATGAPLWFLLGGWHALDPQRPVSPEEAAQSLAPHLISALQDLRRAEARVARDAAAQDRRTPSEEGSA